MITQRIRRLLLRCFEKINKHRGKIILSMAFVVLLFAVHLFFQYRQLEKAFRQVANYTPTQIFSDVTLITPPQSRAYVESRLKGLGYLWDPSKESIEFKLHEPNYPSLLVPDFELVRSLFKEDALIRLEFDGMEPDSVLAAITATVREQDLEETEELRTLYLEPQIVTRLTRASESETENTNQIRNLISFEDIPSKVWQAIIAVEDHNYLEHPGFNLRAFIRALVVNIRTMSFAQGGSTITQQLVKNLMVRRTKNVFKKLTEIFLSMILELRFEKEEILERYLNEVYLGQIGNLEIHGVAEGAKYFFGKKLSELTLAESAMMAGLIRGPSYYSPYRHLDRALKRQKVILNEMVETGVIVQQEMDEALEETVRIAPPPRASNKAPYFTDYVKAQLIEKLSERMTELEISDAGFKVYTTLDVYRNQIAQKAVRKGINKLEKRFGLESVNPDQENEMLPQNKIVLNSKENRLEGALASVDHSNGYIRALVGGRSYSRSTFNRILNMKRQVGSTFKPIVYLSAFEKLETPDGRIYGPGFPALDQPWKLIYDRERQEWSPKNYKLEYRGWIPLKVAFANSINTVAARLGTEIGLPQIILTARKLGILSELPAVPSLALGVAELSPIELLRTYSLIANRGIQDDLTVIRAITTSEDKPYARFEYEPKQKFEPGPMELLTHLMQSVFEDGTASSAYALGFDRPAAGKTGTTSDHRDSWFAGFTPQLTTVVWVGWDKGNVVNKKGEARVRLSGAVSALPVWVDYMKDALAYVPPSDFARAETLTDMRIDRHTGQLASDHCPESQVIVEKYIMGKAPYQTSCAAHYPEIERVVTIE